MTQPSQNDSAIDEFKLDYKPKFQIFHELMAKRINKVLLVSSYYDSFILEEDGRLSDQIFEEFHNLNLRTLPVVTRVDSANEALRLIRKKKFDLVITMRRLGDMDIFAFGRKLKRIRNIPVVVLLNNVADIPYLPDISTRKGIDSAFLWNGDSTVFVAIIKYLEDQLNVAYDTRVGLVRVIIVIEDSIRYYSIFLPIIYSEIMKQTHRLISEGVNDYHHLLQMRIRPKILLASNYEQAMKYYKQYKQFIIGVISDVRFPRKGVLDDNAGITFIKELKKDDYTVPIALQSSDKKNKTKAESLGVFFINKNSRKLLKTIRNFMLTYLGFGDFKFRLSDGTIVGKARNILELEQAIATVPEESLIYHGAHDHFSGWLMNRGEFAIAQKLKPRKVTEFTKTSDLRAFLLNSVNAILTEKTGGVINDFSRENYHPAIRFTRLRPGSLGGKGRGIAFLQFLLNSFLLADDLSKRVSIRIPKTFVIGTDEFDRFMYDNEDLHEIAISDTSDDIIKASFLEANLNPSLKGDLRFILKTFTGPLSVRSSSLLEDSQYQPFAGVFETYMLPNNQDLETRVNLLCGAIKLVYASSFLRQAKSYAESTGQSVEESKMAVVIQQVVGRKRPDNLSYPCFSGVATSYNYYPISYMKPEDRIVFLALGLGKTIVDGGLSVRFCPKYPEVSFYSTQDQVFANSQKEFFAIDLQPETSSFDQGEDSFLRKVNVFDADPTTLENLADTYDYNDNMLRPGYHGQGAPVITFNNQLKYEKFPFAELLTKILSLGERTMGSSVEIEFAGNFQTKPNKKNTFYLLQIRPYTQYDVILDDERKDILDREVLIKSTIASGNRVITDIYDVVFVKPENFDKLKTQQMVTEVDKINNILKDEKKPYILIGFGRWGTFDTSLGIPVRWDNISGAQVIIEAGLKDFQIDHSQGSHFFQNITTANIGYLFVNFKSKEDMIDWNWLSEQDNVISDNQYVKHIRTDNPFYIRIDGRKREGIIYKPDI